MSAWVAIPLALVGAAVLAERGALVAMFVARRTAFYDRPAGYKVHGAPTPYLGGAAVLAAALVAAIALDGVPSRFAAIVACAAMLWLIGTIDDRVNMGPQWRLLAEAGAGAVLYSANLGFTAFASGALNLGFSILWVVAIVNAFNLMDNIDGACAALAAVSAAGIGAAALARGDTDLAVIGVAAAGASVGFLRHNLSKPARIFLGDGGSMPLGFLVAALSMAVVRRHGLGPGELFACGLLAGLPVLDTSLVMVSRTRRGAPLLTGGRDHLTHRLFAKLGTPLRVVIILAVVQGLVVTLAVLGEQAGESTAVGVGVAALLLGALGVIVFDSRRWAPVPVGTVAEEEALGVEPAQLVALRSPSR